MLKGSPLIIGEVLFDVFSGEEEEEISVLGGAPFNVAWHLQGFGLSPLMITAVGNDPHGEQVVNAMAEWGMDTRCVQTDNEHPTGRVSVALKDGIPTFDILADQAYDHVDADKVFNTLAGNDYSMLYHGTLMARTPHSRHMIENVASNTRLPAFVDINLRDPWWSRDIVQKTLANARWVKLNEDELLMVMGEDTKPNAMAGHEDLRSLAQACLTQFDLEMLIVTLGDKGAFCVTRDTILQGPPVKAEKLVDTVGAGDSFSAVMIYGLSRQWPLQTTLDRALQFAAAVCEMRGATTSDRQLYDRFLNEWQ